MPSLHLYNRHSHLQYSLLPLNIPLAQMLTSLRPQAVFPANVKDHINWIGHLLASMPQMQLKHSFN